VSEQGKARLYEVAVLTFRNTILLGRMRAGHTVGDARALKIPMELVILAPPVRLNCLDFGAQKAFDVCLEGVEDLLNIRLVFEKINPAKPRVVINKTNIVLKTSGGGNSRTPNIRVDQLKRHSGHTMRCSIR
jgi:hypothetical protein